MKSSSSKVRAADSETLMDSFLQSTLHSSGSEREAWYARETMLSLMRLARSEQLLDIRCSVRKLLPESSTAMATKRATSRRTAIKQPGQKQLAFGRED